MSPRIIPNTTYTRRVEPTTTYTKPRDSVTLISFDDNSGNYTFDSLLWTFDSDTTAVEVTVYTTPRYDTWLEEIGGENVFDISGEQVKGVSGKRTNILDTFYT